MKRCSKCKKLKPLEEFGRHPRAKDGLQSACKACFAAYQRERRKNPTLKAIDRERIKHSMDKRKDYYDELHNEARRRRRQSPEYRGQERTYDRELYARHYKDDPEYQKRNRQRVAQWIQENQGTPRYKLSKIKRENARRARKQAAQVTGPVSLAAYEAVLAAGLCVYCGKPADTVDHITPLARGGHEAEYNLAPACRPCNSSKGRKLLTEWDQARLAHAIACSPKIIAQLAWQAQLH